MSLKKKIILIILAALLLALIGLAIYSVPPAFSLYRHARLAEGYLKQTASAWQSKDWNQIQANLKSFQEENSGLRQELVNLKFFQSVPVLKDNYQALSQLSLAAASISSAGQELTDMLEKIWPVFADGSSYGQLSLEDKKKFLQELYQSAPILQGVKANLDIANVNLQDLPPNNLFGPIKDVVSLVDQYLPAVNSSLDLLSSGIQALPDLAGYGGAKTYLVIMQNNDELRPSGGFIGTFGILKVKDGEIVSLSTSDSYALDRTAESYLRAVPPEPIGRYLTKYWWFRDANWSPDWPASAQTTADFYRREGGQEKIDGVIAFDPTMVSRILSVVGSLMIYDLKLDPQNFSDILQYEVEMNYPERDLTKQERKDIIGQLGDQLVEKLSQVPAGKWLDLLSIVSQGLREKHILIYDYNKNLEAIYLANGWAGQVKDYSGDYLMVVDANMAALKTDRVMDKKIDYQIAKDASGKLIATVTLTYANQGKNDYRTTRLRDYVRIYVPAGSRLIKVEGAMPNDRGGDAKALPVIDSGAELGKTWFGAFWYINPGETKKLTFQYQLPDRILKVAEQSGIYPILAQKQPGTAGHQLTIGVKLDSLERSLQTDLTVDREIVVK